MCALLCVVADSQASFLLLLSPVLMCSLELHTGWRAIQHASSHNDGASVKMHVLCSHERIHVAGMQSFARFAFVVCITK